ncbi:uncharacterized protein [Lepisosteus oculatus]|uniref:uncharacterized protein n=1 Tax=Lepisosteus oculatus TaxID=7918 RepID=UPI0037237E79
MTETAERIAATLTTNQNCTIEITNLTSGYILASPRNCMSLEFSFCATKRLVDITKMEVCAFIKDDNTATGCVGVLTYDL